MPFFSVIIPAYNRLPLLKEALESVFSQTFTDYEIIVVDDGSTDGTLEMLRCYGKKIQLLNQKNSGPGAARNLGASVAQGEYLAFLDSDDIWMPWALEVYKSAINNHECPSIICASVIEFNNKSEIVCIKKQGNLIRKFPDYFSSWRLHLSVGSGMAVIKRSCFLKSGGFNVMYINCEDHDLMLRCGDLTGFIKIDKPYILAYRRHTGGTTQILQRTISGVSYLIENEQKNVYPGGIKYSRHRKSIISSHVRPVSLSCLQNHQIKDGWTLYWKIFAWNLMLGRWKYLIGFFIKTI